MAQDASSRADAETVFTKVPIDLTTQGDSIVGATWESVYDVTVDGKVFGRVVRRRAPARAARPGGHDRSARPWRALLLIDGQWVDLDGWFASRIDAYVALRSARDGQDAA